jgi:hypothetical protein
MVMDHKSIWRNKKTNGLYEVLFSAQDATNGREMQAVFVYMDTEGKKFVRNSDEFLEKFEHITSHRSGG